MMRFCSYQVNIVDAIHGITEGTHLKIIWDPNVCFCLFIVCMYIYFINMCIDSQNG